MTSAMTRTKPIWLFPTGIMIRPPQANTSLRILIPECRSMEKKRGGVTDNILHIGSVVECALVHRADCVPLDSMVECRAEFIE